jgi:hypothetical protein
MIDKGRLWFVHDGQHNISRLDLQDKLYFEHGEDANPLEAAMRIDIARHHASYSLMLISKNTCSGLREQRTK